MRHRFLSATNRAATALALIATLPADAGQPLTVDARAPATAPVDGYIKLGGNVAPDGTVLSINSQYLTLNGQPWMPVMGEVHFVRLPESEWDTALAKMKASGIDIVATYMFWNYHEETPGAFNWSGERNLRQFLKLAASHGLKVVLRIGPWSHAEVRYGGIPDWVVQSTPLRRSDPQYLRYVERYWAELGKQVEGQFWKDGGPIIAVQLENEYNLTGAQRGRDHIADLKAIALRLGFDAPFFTATGWDGAVYPPGEFVPVFGGYPDEPWAVTDQQLPPKETYAFRFDSRVSGNLGAQTAGGAGDADSDIPRTPFLGAEYAGGLPVMYRRRPVVSPRDIAAMIPTQIGSGNNLYGYYMYHGGRNLVGRTTLEENTAIGGYNDLPIINYDFQAPFGAYGEANPVLDYIRPFHYMMASYGQQIAVTNLRKPRQVPQSSADLATLRWAVRSNGESGFLFVNNHIRHYPMAEQTGKSFAVELANRTITFPSKPVTIPSGAYFIWPFGLDLGGQRLDWASAQPVVKIDTPEGPLHVFSASDGIAPEFAFAPGMRIKGAPVVKTGGSLVARVARPGTSALLTVSRPQAPTIRILVLTESQARKLWRVELAGQTRILLTNDSLAGEGENFALTSTGDARFDFSIWPTLPPIGKSNLALSKAKPDGIFSRYTAQAAPVTMRVAASQLRAPEEAPKIRIGGPANAAVQPVPESFGNSAGAWQIAFDQQALARLDDAILAIDWAGDIGRLYAGETLIDDHFFDGTAWRIGLKRHAALLDRPLTLRIIPLREDAPIYLERALRPDFGSADQLATIRQVRIEPRYRLDIAFAAPAPR